MTTLSIRQPWAWLILHAGKDVENRCWPTHFRGRVLIHAGKAMTRQEYKDAFDFVLRYAREAVGIFPDQRTMPRGGIVGSVDIVDCVDKSASPWFCGPYGFVLRNPAVLPFWACAGQLGFFQSHAL